MTEKKQPVDHMRDIYLAQVRRILPQTRTGKLTKAGEQQAYLWLVGYLMGEHEALEIDWSQSTTYFLAQVRGADFALGVTETGERDA